MDQGLKGLGVEVLGVKGLAVKGLRFRGKGNLTSYRLSG